MSSELKIKNYNIDDLVPYARNPRKNDDSVDAIAASIKEFGFTQPIVINKDGVIVAGHTRLKAAKKLGLKQVPVAIAEHWTEEQAKAYRLLDNKLAEKSSWDLPLLQLEMEELSMSLDPFDVSFESMLPLFEPASFNEQGKLDEKKKQQCPHCGYEFEN